jgi:dephospho-CoA kinase
VLRLGVVPIGAPADAAADALRRHGIDVAPASSAAVALTVAVAPPGGRVRADTVDAVLTAHDGVTAAEAAAELYRARLAPWVQALTSGRPDVTGPPVLVEHDPTWAAVADRRTLALRRALGVLDGADGLGLRRVDHIGSTAVRDLAAKPYLDLQVVLDRLPDRAALAAALAPLGWAPAVGARPDSPGVHRDTRRDEDTAPDAAYVKQLFVAPDPVRPAILHVRLTASPFARRVVRLRDGLRADPRLRHGYEQVKRRAAAAHAGDRDYDDYTRAKGGWLTDTYRQLENRAGGARDPWPLDP